MRCTFALVRVSSFLAEWQQGEPKSVTGQDLPPASLAHLGVASTRWSLCGLAHVSVQLQLGPILHVHCNVCKVGFVLLGDALIASRWPDISNLQRSVLSQFHPEPSSCTLCGFKPSLSSHLVSPVGLVSVVATLAPSPFALCFGVICALCHRIWHLTATSLGTLRIESNDSVDSNCLVVLPLDCLVCYSVSAMSVFIVYLYGQLSNAPICGHHGITALNCI